MNNRKQTILISLLASQTLLLVIYTIFTVSIEGWTLFQIVNNNIMSLGWNGQFNLDFSSYLLLSALWIGWRSKFSPLSMLIAVIAAIVGIMAFAPYIIYLIISEKGDLKKVLLGSQG